MGYHLCCLFLCSPFKPSAVSVVFTFNASLIDVASLSLIFLAVEMNIICQSCMIWFVLFSCSQDR